MCRLIAKRPGQHPARRKEGETCLPLYQFRASDGEGASKYRTALLSTNRSAITRTSIGCAPIFENQRLTVSMDDTGRLWQRLHPQNSPQIHRGVWVLALRWISAQHE